MIRMIKLSYKNTLVNFEPSMFLMRFVTFGQQVRQIPRGTGLSVGLGKGWPVHPYLAPLPHRIVCTVCSRISRSKPTLAFFR